jgi:hypothetical protein
MTKPTKSERRLTYHGSNNVSFCSALNRAHFIINTPSHMLHDGFWKWRLTLKHRSIVILHVRITHTHAARVKSKMLRRCVCNKYVSYRLDMVLLVLGVIPGLLQFSEPTQVEQVHAFHVPTFHACRTILYIIRKYWGPSMNNNMRH